MLLNEYDFDVQIYNQAINVETECIDITFINLGTNTVFVRNVPITANNSLPITGNVGEIMRRPVTISFDPAGVGTNKLMVIRRTYVNG